jgi:hypothetical protein
MRTVAGKPRPPATLLADEEYVDLAVIAEGDYRRLKGSAAVSGISAATVE